MSIKVENLKYVYMDGGPFEKRALDDINLSIGEHELIAVIGHTGSGKSTLIQHFNGLIKPSSGRILVDGEDVNAKETSLRDIRRKVGLVFQYPEHQLFEETVRKDIAFGPKNMGLSKEEIEERVEYACECVELKRELLEKSPFELSGGQKRRVAIAGVIAMKPEVLVLDEPTAGLDPKGSARILDMVKRLYENSDMSVILVSHSMEEVAKTVNRIIVMSDGNMIMDGSVEEIFSNADKLREVGLDVPQICKLCNKLRAKGYDIDKDIYTVDKAKEAILKLIKKGGCADA